MVDDHERAVSVYYWEAARASSSGGELENEDARELAFLDMVTRQLSLWDDTRVRRVLNYLSSRFTYE